MDLQKQAVNLRELWDSRRKRGMLAVLEEMNELLAQGLISDNGILRLGGSHYVQVTY